LKLKEIAILFVDDDTEVCEIIKYILKDEIRFLHIAKDGVEGFAMYCKFRPDIVITDVRMPLMDGLEMAQKIKEIDSSQNIVLLSAFSETEVFKKAIEIKVDKFFTKPLKDLEEFLGALTSISNSIGIKKEVKKSTHEDKEKNRFIDKHIMLSTSDLNGNIIDISSAFLKISGYKKEEVIGKNHSIFRGKKYCVYKFAQMWKDLEEDKTWEGELENISKDGKVYFIDMIIEPIRDERGVKIGYKSIKQDITEKKDIKILSQKDTLTGIGNRRSFETNLQIQQDNVTRYEIKCSLIMIDIDDFKSVNDTYGHLVGDEVLKEFANILTSNIRKSDIAARWGGEEFAVVTPNLDINDAFKFAQKLRVEIENFNFLNKIKLTASFGLSTLGKNKTINDIIHQADEALYFSKGKGKNLVMISS